MISEELKTIIDKLKNQDEMYFFEETTEEKIQIFEKEKGFTLPLKYKEWLLFSDGGELFLPAGIQLYGIEHKPFIDVTDDSKPNDDYIVIGVFASGDPILCKKSEEPIFIYNQEIGKIDEELVYQDFLSFLNDLYELLGIESQNTSNEGHI